MISTNYVRPSTLEEAYELLLESEKNLIIGGGAWLKLTNREVETIIDIRAIGLHEIIEQDDAIEIGAMTSLRQIETSDILMQFADGIVTQAVKSIMGINVRNLATIGGSIMGKYSFSDILTPLLALDTSLVFYNLGTISLTEFLERKKPPRDILTKVVIKKHPTKAYFYNMKKTALDFAVINVAVVKTENIHITIGARPSIAMRAFAAEQFLNALPKVSKKDILKAAALAVEEIKLGSNQRASEAYRTSLAEVYIRRGLEEVYGIEN